MLLTANRVENDATRRYLEPLDEQGKIYEYIHRKQHGSHQDYYATFFIGKFAGCIAAVRNIRQGSAVQSGAASAPMMAFDCFSNLGAIIAVGVACGVEEETNICDVIVATKVARYDQARMGVNETLNRGATLETSSFLVELFDETRDWLSDDQKKRLVDAGFKGRMPKIVYGEILSGPFLIDDPEVKAKVIKNFAPEAKGIEMEAAYLAAATQRTKAHIIIVKAVCDFGDGNRNNDFQPTAAILAAQCVHSYLSRRQISEMLCAKGMCVLYAYRKSGSVHFVTLQVLLKFSKPGTHPKLAINQNWMQ